MGVLDEFKRLVHPYADDEDDFDDEFEDDEEFDEEEEEEEEERPARGRRQARQQAAAPVRPAPAAPMTAAPASSAAPAASMMNTAGSSYGNLRAGGMQMVLVKPERYEDVCSVADHLRNRNAVVLNLEATNRDTSRRLVDFLSGCAYALDGNVKKVATNTYVIAPANVDIVGQLVTEEQAQAE